MLPPVSSGLSRDDEGHPMLDGELGNGLRHIRPLELDDFGAHALCFLNVVDKLSLHGGVYSVGPLIGSLDVDAVPVEIEPSRDATRLSQQLLRQRQLAREC